MQHKWPFAHLKRCPEFCHYAKYTCPFLMKQPMVLSGSWCQYTWQHKHAIFAFLDAVSRCIWSSFPSHPATTFTFLKLCVRVQFCFTRRCVMQKKVFRTNWFVLVLFISNVKLLASQSIFQIFVHLRASLTCVITMFVFDGFLVMLRHKMTCGSLWTVVTKYASFGNVCYSSCAYSRKTDTSFPEPTLFSNTAIKFWVL